VEARKADQWRSDATETLQTLLRATEKAGGLGIGKESGFAEIVKKHEGRFDVCLDHMCDDDDAFITQARASIREQTAPLLKELFGPHFRENAQGMVVTEPGAGSQDWHIDSSWLFGADPEQPCHFVTCFMPLYDPDTAIGPTEFALGSHRHTWRLGRETVPEQYPQKSVCDALLDCPGVELVRMECSPGDVVVMDGR